MARSITLTRDEAEMIVDLCESTSDRRLWCLAEELRTQWGMIKSVYPPNIPDLGYLGIIADKDQQCGKKG